MAGTFLAAGILVTYLTAGYWGLDREFLVVLALVSLSQAGVVWAWLRWRARRSRVKT